MGVAIRKPLRAWDLLRSVVAEGPWGPPRFLKTRRGGSCAGYENLEPNEGRQLVTFPRFDGGT